jgi:hypothetical protein
MSTPLSDGVTLTRLADPSEVDRQKVEQQIEQA